MLNKAEGTSASIREALYLGVPVVANAAESQPQGVFVYPWGNADAMIEMLETVLADSDMGQKPPTQLAALDVPDTVSEEVELLVRCTLGRGRISKRLSQVRQVTNPLTCSQGDFQ